MVDQVELLGGILASERQDGKFVVKVILEEASDVTHRLTNKGPVIWLGCVCVLRRILPGETTPTPPPPVVAAPTVPPAPASGAYFQITSGG
jgi:hypothetical protein